MFVRLTDSTAAWSVHLRPGCRDYSVSLFIKPEPFKPAGLVLCNSACSENEHPPHRFTHAFRLSATVSDNTREHDIKTSLFNTDSNKFRWEVELHGRLLKAWNLGPFMLSSRLSGFHVVLWFSFSSAFLTPFFLLVMLLFQLLLLAEVTNGQGGVFGEQEFPNEGQQT